MKMLVNGNRGNLDGKWKNSPTYYAEAGGKKIAYFIHSDGGRKFVYVGGEAASDEYDYSKDGLKAIDIKPLKTWGERKIVGTQEFVCSLHAILDEKEIAGYLFWSNYGNALGSCCEPYNPSKSFAYRNSKLQNRRQRLLDDIIIPNFGVSDGNGHYKLPKRLSTGEVVRKLRKYPRMMTKYGKIPYKAVRKDLLALGIKTMDISSTVQMKLKKDEEFAARMKDVSRLKEGRQKAFESDPEREQQMYRRSAEMRKIKFAEDQKFNLQVNRNLSLGNAAHWEKYRTDEHYRKSWLEKEVKNLKKGIRTQQKRVERRRKVLSHLVDRTYGSPFQVIVTELKDYLERCVPAFAKKYYPKGVSYKTLKRDVKSIKSASSP